MQGNWLFWLFAAGGAAACLAVVFRPLLAGGGRAERRASFDVQVHRDQLREIEADQARGVLSAGEAAATRLEVSRRLLAAADAEAAEAAAGAAPTALSRRLAAGLVAALTLAALGLYGWLGAGGAPDLPLAPRLAEAAAEYAQRPGQAEAEALAARAAPPPESPGGEDVALVERLAAALRTRPDNLEGHRMLARNLASLGRWAEARTAQERVVALLGAQATAQDFVDLAAIRIFAAGGYVSPEAEDALRQALGLDPQHPMGRYYSALALLQGGRPGLAFRIWSALVAEGPPDAPWIASARAGAAEAAALAGLPAAMPPGPSAADVDAAAEMAPEDRQAMIEGMVAQLSGRLADQGGPPEDWARLIRSLGVLGRREQAAAILAEARTTHAADPAGMALIEAAAREAGLAP